MTESEVVSAVNEIMGFLNGGDGHHSVCVQKAIYDVIAAIPGFQITDFKLGDLSIRAVAEQTEYLKANLQKLTEREVKTSESVDGLSASFSNVGLPEISPRAQIYIQRVKAAFNGSTLRVNRG